MVNIVPIRAFQDNYIWLITNPNDSNAIVVDPGDAQPVLNYLASKNLTLQAILITHHHFDHSAGIAGLVAKYDVPVYGPMDEEVPGVTHTLNQDDSITFPNFNLTFNVIALPGHTHGHIAYYAPGILFCGDTLFTAGCGRVFESSYEQMYHSLMKLSALPEDTLIYCGHEYTEANLIFAHAVEPHNQEISDRLAIVRKLHADNIPTVPATLKIEHETNPFLRCHLQAVKNAAKTREEVYLPDEVTTFMIIRQWKNGFSY
jgi:hydroxyacylglutathione hydrolase